MLWKAKKTANVSLADRNGKATDFRYAWKWEGEAPNSSVLQHDDGMYVSQRLASRDTLSVWNCWEVTKRTESSYQQTVNNFIVIRGVWMCVGLCDEQLWWREGVWVDPTDEGVPSVRVWPLVLSPLRWLPGRAPFRVSGNVVSNLLFTKPCSPLLNIELSHL